MNLLEYPPILTELPPYDKAAWAMREFHDRSAQLLNRILAPHGTTLPRMMMLMFIHRAGSARSIDLMAAFPFAPRTITESIDSLETKGLVTRTPDLKDRRSKRIELTDEGRAKLVRILPIIYRFGEDLFGTMADEELDAVAAMFDRLNARVAEIEAALPK